MIHKQRLNNRILSLVLALVMVLSMLPLSAVPAHAATESPCSGDHSDWTAITTTGQTTISKPGKYYLQKDMIGDVNYTTLKINCTGDVTLCLNGKTINSYPPVNTSTYRQAIDLQSGNLSLCDCVGSGKITRMYDYGSAEGVNIASGTTFNMYGGTFTGLTSDVVTVFGVFNMYGGSISGNVPNINGNVVVNVYNGTFNMYGGSITNNEGIGVRQARYGSGTQAIYLEGDVKISGNSGGNIGLKTGKTVTVGELTDGAEIYVTSDDTGSHIAITGTNAVDYSQYFHADDSSYQILNKDNVIYLHKHSYSAANCVAPATCACGLTEGSKDSTNHNISTEWITENGKHYKECLNGCGTKFEEGACSGGTATCITPEICEVCGVPYCEALGHDFVGGICSRCGISEEGVYHIFTAEQLVSFAALVNAGDKSANAILMADIDMAGCGWTPICQTDSYHTSGSTVTDAGYAGTFDGNGHVISNLTVKGGDSGIKSYGLFGTLSGTVKRLGLDNYSFNVGSADCRAGGIAGQVVSGGLITDCYVINSEVLTGSRIAGGITGCNYGGTIQNCFVQNTEVTGSSDRFGWISGDCQDDGENKPGTVINCYTDGTRAVSSRSSNATIRDCAVVTDEQFATGEITYKLNGSTSEGELVWKQTIGTHEHPVFEGGTVYKVSCETVELYSNENRDYETHDFVKGICSRCGELMPAVNNNGIYEIHNVGQLIWFAEYVNAGNTTASAKLMADIDLNGHGNVMIGTSSAKYSGTFDGNGKKLTVSFDSTEQYIAPFRYINGATIRDLTVDGTIATSQKFAAGLIGYSEGNSKIEKCMVSVTINSTVSGDGTHGGLVANVSAGSMTIDNCGFIGTITGNGTHSCGGFVGWANSTTTISNSYVSGTFTTGTTNCYTFGRNAEKITVSNSYYKTAYGTDDSGATQKSADRFASGEVTYLLNGSTSEGDLVWYQTLETDAYPQFTGSVVYYDSVNGYNNHIHNWTYTEDGDKITATCDVTGCTNPNGGSVTIVEPEDLTYDGKTKDATLSYAEWQPEETPTITYSGADDRENVTGKDITASITLGNAEAKVTYRVEAASITGATVTVDSNADLTYTGSAITPAVTVKLGDKSLDTASYEVSYANNVNAGTATITVTGKGNYKNTATATFTIVDKTEPAGEILIKDNGWKQFLNWITFGIFCKDNVDVTITADGTGSGVAKVEYLLSGTALDENNLPTEGWTELTANDGKYSFSIKPQNKTAVYVRITDEYNNVTVINSDGIVVYEDSEAIDTEVTYTYNENSDKDVAVTFNGNTVKSIVCGEATLVAGTDYTVDYDSGKIVLNATYLNTLNASDAAYTFTVSYNPMGVADSGVTDLADTTFTVKVNKAQISTATVNVTAPEAGEAKQTDVADGTGYSAAISWNCDTDTFGYNTAYTATVTLTADSNHKFTSDLTSSGWNVVVSADGTTATLTKAYEATRKAKLTAISAPTDSTLNKYYTDVADAIKELPTTVVYTTEGGSVTVNIEWACSNYDYAVTKTNIFTWTVKGGELDNYNINGVATTGTITVTNASAITVNNSGENKTVTYNGSTYDVAGMFTIDKNAGEASYAITGGTGEGTLNGSVLTITTAGTFEIKLTTAANGAYAAGEATATLTVNKGAGSGTMTIDGWTYGEDANTPVVNSSTNGDAGVTYFYESTDGKGYTGSAAPENAGSYKLTVTFAETDLYEACTDDATFTIEQKKITASITGSISKVYDGTSIVPNGLGLSIVLSEIGTGDVTATASYAYDGVNVGTTKINATDITLSGADAGNYKLTATTASANVGTITQATPAYTKPTGLTATYGDTLADVTLPEGFTWEAALTTAVGNVGDRDFTVTYTPGDTLNYKTVTGIVVNIDVKAAAASVATAPTAISGLIYNKTAQALITAGTANGGELQYSLSKDSGYSTTIPTGTGAGTYTVWYKVVGDSNHSDTAPVSIQVKIGKADPAIGAVTAGVVNDTLDISAIALNRADTTVDGVLTVDAEQELKLGDNEIAYTFTPADTDNYERVTGKVTVTVKDTIAPTGKVTLGANSWNEFLNDITFGLFFKETQTVSVEASDSFSGVEKIEYCAASDVLDLDGVKALADDKWTVMDGSVNVTAEDAKQFIYYIRITDKSGNIGYLATNGAEFDTTAPVINGVHDGVTYYTTQKITVTDTNLDTVTLNGEAVTGTITLDGNKGATYIIVATDKAGNSTTVTVTMKLTESLGAPLDGITENNVTSEDKETVQDVIDQVEDLLDDEDLTEEEKAILEEIKEEAEKLIEKIEEVTEATDTANTEKVEDITPENVKPEDKTDLEKAKEDLEDALENNGDNYTEDEKKAIQEEIDRIDEALEVIDRVEKVEQQIENLPDTITKDDTDDVDAAKKAYDELSDYEKTLIDPVVKEKLDNAVKAAEDVDKPADTNSPQTGDNTNLWLWIALLFISGGAVITLTVYDRKRRTVNR